MRVVRRDLFETNSSSVHTLCVSKTVNPDKPDKVVFARGRFGWGPEVFNDMSDRLSYLYENLLGIADESTRNSYIDMLKKYLDSIHVEYAFEHDADRYCGIDHPEDSEGVIQSLFDGDDQTLLDRFMFGKDSCVICDNDNAYDRERLAPPEGHNYDLIHR